jgi:hypothetical protein
MKLQIHMILLIGWLKIQTITMECWNLGNFIPGFYATSLLSRHPALKAVSPQACISDFSLMIFTITEPIWAIESHAAFGIQRRNATSAWYHSSWKPKMIIFFMNAGPLSNLDAFYGKDNEFWQQLKEHSVMMIFAKRAFCNTYKISSLL